MNKEKEYIFITDGYRGGANTFMNDHMEYLISKKQKVILFDQNPNKTFEKLNKKISVHQINLKTNKQSNYVARQIYPTIYLSPKV